MSDGTSGPVRDTAGMIAGMRPVLLPGSWRFVTTPDVGLAARAAPLALASFAEDEGLSLVLPAAAADELDFPAGPAMRRITLMVHSALDGVGLTAAVAGALAARGIACNMVAAFHHDHAFVPEDRAEEALAALRALQSGTGA